MVAVYLKALIPLYVALAWVAAIFLLWRAERKAARLRSAELEHLAADRGWTFVAEDKPADNDFAGFAVFRRGSYQRALNTFRGTLSVGPVESPVRGGDFMYVRGGGRTRSCTELSYVLVQLPAATSGPRIRRRTWLDPLRDLFGRPDIDVAGDDFQRLFRVSASDPDFARRLLSNPSLAASLVGTHWTVEVNGEVLCITSGKGRWDPARFGAVLEFVAGFLLSWSSLAMKPGATGP